MQTIHLEYSDLFIRRLVRLFLCVFICLSVLSSKCEAQTNDNDFRSLPSTIFLPQRNYPTTDSLIHTIEKVGDITIGYSSRVLPNPHKPVELKHQRWQLMDILSDIFGRYKVQYHVEERRIIVTLPDGNKRYTISGFLKEADSQEALIGANIYDALLLRGAVSNGYGYYSLTLPEGNVPLRASFVGYIPKNMTIDLKGDTTINIELEKQNNILNLDIEVTNLEPPVDAGAGVITIPIQQVKAMPNLMGESDIIKAMQHTPGIQSGEDGFGGLSVRGGNSDQNIVLIDNVPLYNPMHLMGLYTVFNAEGINSASLIKGGFPARYGGRMSSVLDIKMREGNMQAFKGYVNIGLLSSNLMFEGPIVENKMSFILSARRTYADIFMGYMQPKRDTRYSFYFYDVSAKLNYIINDKNRLFVSYFMGSDNLNNDYNFRNKTIVYSSNDKREIRVNDEQQYRWGSIVSSVRWNRTYGGKVFSNVTASFSRYRFRNQEEKVANDNGGISTSTYFSGLNDFSVKADASYYPAVGFVNTVRVGGDATVHSLYPGFTIVNRAVSYGDTITAEKRHPLRCLEAHAYIESQMQMERLSANMGVHFSGFDSKNQSPYFQIEPRLLLSYKPVSSVLLKLGGSCMSQFLQQMHMTTVDTPADMWLPVSSKLPPPRVWQASLEGEFNVSENLRISLEGYRKNYVRLQTYKTSSGVELLSNADWDALMTGGHGYANGMEIMLHKTGGRLSGWVGYSLSKSENAFSGINGGKYYPTDYDKRHCTTVYAVYAVKSHVDLSALWTFNTGAPVTIPDGQYKLITGGTLAGQISSLASLPGEKNKYRMNNSHSLTLGCNIHYDKPKGEHTLSFGVYNVYGQKNAMFIYWVPQGEGESTTYNLKQYSLTAFPLPYITYSFRF